MSSCKGPLRGDVRGAIAWLSANGYTLSSHRGEGTLGAQFAYAGDARVVIIVDRSQWMLDVAPRPDAEPWQYELADCGAGRYALRRGLPEGWLRGRSRTDSLSSCLEV